MKISRLMTKNPVTVSKESPLTDAASLMWRQDCGVVVVIDDARKVIGMITDRDIAMAALTQGVDLGHAKVKKSMSKRVFTIDENDDLSDALELMSDHQIRRLPVVNASGALTGIVSLNDIALQYKKDGGKAISAEQIAAAVASICARRSAEKQSAA